MRGWLNREVDISKCEIKTISTENETFLQLFLKIIEKIYISGVRVGNGVVLIKTSNWKIIQK